MKSAMGLDSSFPRILEGQGKPAGVLSPACVAPISSAGGGICLKPKMAPATLLPSDPDVADFSHELLSPSPAPHANLEHQLRLKDHFVQA